MKRALILPGVLVGLLVAMTGWDLWSAMRLRSGAVERCARPAQRLEGEAYLRGRLAVIDARAGAWEALVGGHLPRDLAPARAEEIGTCALLEWGAPVDAALRESLEARLGRKLSADEAVGLGQNCKVTLIDLQRGAIIHEVVIFGRGTVAGAQGGTPSPPQALGNKPATEVEDFLFRLPRK